jgi:heme exporter protein CcmD
VNLGEHAGFIVAAYAAVVVVVAALIVWIAADFRAQKRMLAQMENRAAGTAERAR